jgi:RND family efflux transporter MFP subunit
MTPLKQGVVSIVVLAAAAGGWESFQHRDQLFGQNGSGTTASAKDAGSGARSGAVNVVVAPVKTEIIGDELRSIGTAASIKATTLYAQSSGLIDKIYVESGAQVEAGAALVHLDDQNESIAVDNAKIALADAQKANDRAAQLAMSQVGTQVNLSSSESTLAKAKSDLNAAQVALDRRTIAAPFAGTIGLTTHVVGDFVTSTTPIATLDDLSAFTVTFDASQRFAAAMKMGVSLTATAEGLPGAMIRGSVTAVDTRVDESTRAFKVRATLTEGIDGLKPGMATIISVTFAGVPQATVLSSAVLWDRQGSYVWKLNGNVARRTAVGILGRRGGTVIISGDLKEGDEVAVEGLQRLRDGVAVAGVDDSTSGSGSAATSPPRPILPSPAS